MKARLAIKSTRYRDKEGYLVYGTDGRGRSGQRVFTESRIAAERIRDKMKRGEEISLVDFSDTETETFPTTRHMSIQAWRRLGRAMTNGELRDLAADIAAFVGLSEKQKEEIVFALTGFNWETRKQI